MLYWWLQSAALRSSEMATADTGDSPVFLTARIAAAALTSFVAALVFGPLAIRWLRSKKLGERIVSASTRLNELHAGKQNTPTMGGLFIVAAILASTALWADLGNRYVQLAMAVTAGFAVLGGADDWIKLRTSRRGMSARGKLVGQIGLALLASGWLLWIQQGKPLGDCLVSPIGTASVSLGVGYLAWAAFVMVGSSNAVNLTDGLDGLAPGSIVFTGAAMTGLTYLAGHRVLAEYLVIPHFAGVGELAVIIGALIGAAMGFLWFNCHPAEVFMGDTGSLPLGALLGLVAMAIKQEFVFAVVGGIFVAETMSVLLQVGIRRMTGKRILACSPLHHHFQFRGVPETKIVVRFWIVGALLAIAGLASLKLRSM
jgi:phospho-N-acetylmuramoyl-pentapeptide-transferase